VEGEKTMLVFEEPSNYVRANYERNDRLAVVLIYRHPARVKHEFATAEKISSPAYQAHLRAANFFGADIYLTVNTLKPGATGRTKSDIDAVRHVYLDLDGGGKEAVDRIVSAPGMPLPHHILNTSPGKHQLIWSVTGFDRDQAENLVRGLAARHGADQAVWDAARVLRVPGFRNHKYESIKHYVKDLQSDPAAVSEYRPADFPEIEMAGDPVMPAAASRTPGLPNRGVSQSERDWAAVMGALQRGDHPRAIQAWLERSRQDKPKPRYYAQRTVQKAIQEHDRYLSNRVEQTRVEMLPEKEGRRSAGRGRSHRDSGS
jgi:hypothetical protein